MRERTGEVCASGRFYLFLIAGIATCFYADGNDSEGRRNMGEAAGAKP